MAQHLVKLNPELKYDIHHQAFNQISGKAIASDYDLLLDCTDRIEVRYEINDVAVLLDKPWVYGAVHAFEGQVTVFNYKNGPTYRCLFPEKESAAVPNCEELGVVGPLPGIIGLYQAMETIKIIVGFGKVLSGRLLLVDLKEQQHRELKFSRSKTAKAIVKQNIQEAGNKVLKLIKEDEIEALLKINPDIQFVDLRDYPDAKLPFKGTLSIPYYSFDSRLNELDKSLPVILICEAGLKSKWAAHLLLENNFKEVYPLVGKISGPPTNN
jgi:adenylyltransferase/sulfurtransferase